MTLRALNCLKDLRGHFNELKGVGLLMTNEAEEVKNIISRPLRIQFENDRRVKYEH